MCRLRWCLLPRWQISSPLVLRPSTSFGEIVRSHRLAEVEAGRQEAADASDWHPSWRLRETLLAFFAYPANLPGPCVLRNQDVHAEAQASHPAKTAALTKAQAEHKIWLKAQGIKVMKNTLRT
jgi:hypothetical protein